MRRQRRTRRASLTTPQRNFFGGVLGFLLVFGAGLLWWTVFAVLPYFISTR